MNKELLKQKTEMLEEYFGICIEPSGNLLKIPVILDQYMPNMDHFPEFVLCLGDDVSVMPFISFALFYLHNNLSTS